MAVFPAFVHQAQCESKQSEKGGFMVIDLLNAFVMPAVRCPIQPSEQNIKPLEAHFRLQWLKAPSVGSTKLQQTLPVQQNAITLLACIKS